MALAAIALLASGTCLLLIAVNALVAFAPWATGPPPSGR